MRKCTNFISHRYLGYPAISCILLVICNLKFPGTLRNHQDKLLTLKRKESNMIRIGKYTFEEVKPKYDKFAVRCIQTNERKESNISCEEAAQLLVNIYEFKI